MAQKGKPGEGMKDRQMPAMPKGMPPAKMPAMPDKSEMVDTDKAIAEGQRRNRGGGKKKK